MIGFRDQTFCAASCRNIHCHRLWTPELSGAAERWWGGPGAPVAFSDFSARCGGHQPLETLTSAAGQESPVGRAAVQGGQSSNGTNQTPDQEVPPPNPVSHEGEA